MKRTLLWLSILFVAAICAPAHAEEYPNAPTAVYHNYDPETRVATLHCIPAFDYTDGAEFFPETYGLILQAHGAQPEIVVVSVACIFKVTLSLGFNRLAVLVQGDGPRGEAFSLPSDWVGINVIEEETGL